MPSHLLMILPALLLCALLAAAVWHDLRSRRIPNRLVFPGALAALALHTLLPAGGGLFGAPFGGLGPLAALAGMALGLAALLPMYMLRAMGAGDVKLLAMVGAFLGPHAIVGAALGSVLAGGVLALAVALWQGKLAKVLGNLHEMLVLSLMRGAAGEGARIAAPSAPTGKLAYAVAIAAGTLGSLAADAGGRF
ncbi:A24 family peptidase [Janthinobacterium fluminis]|uniref:A24 family peptidase n=1 Tax=Janthinobacterium fluminis TaxID=2987524 RepID=A0ABT5JZD7_9BURK|nr:A24 family peptidase [Janthinobacterium fluminis]MDC8758029.1 A24 family peptidase [Janthinobacterium fluminis]